MPGRGRAFSYVERLYIGLPPSRFYHHMPRNDAVASEAARPGKAEAWVLCRWTRCLRL